MFINSNFLLYTLVVIVIIYLIIAGTIRLKMQFWYTQPVFHMYNLRYWLRPPGFINLEPPPVNKFVNLVNNKMIAITNAGDSSTNAGDNSVKIKQICNFIRDYYVIHPMATYKPTADDILSYLTCSNHPSFFIVYQEPKMLFDFKEELSSSIITDQEIIGVASIRALNVTLLKGKKKTSFPAYYVDNLCVKPGYRKKGIPPQIIQTFYYNMARENNKVNAYMFKREGSLTAIVPLVYFDTYGFDISRFETAYILSPMMSVISIGSQQLNVFVNFIKEQKQQFDCTVVPDVSSLLNLIKMEKFLIYGVLFNGELLAVYIFRPLELYYERGAAPLKPPLTKDVESGSARQRSKPLEKEASGKTVECIAVISSTHDKDKDKDKDILIAGFNMSLLKVKAKCGASTLLVEANAHSQAVIKDLDSNSTVLRMFKNPTAFFLYNYACYSLRSNKTLLIY
jgi:hypothetical protein